MTLKGSEDLSFYIDNYIPDNSYVIGDLYTYNNDGKNIHYDEYIDHFFNTSIDLRVICSDSLDDGYADNTIISFTIVYLQEKLYKNLHQNVVMILRIQSHPFQLSVDVVVQSAV